MICAGGRQRFVWAAGSDLYGRPAVICMEPSLAEESEEDEAFQIITENDVDYLVDMESFIVTTVEDDTEVGTWDDETQSILYFGMDSPPPCHTNHCRPPIQSTASRPHKPHPLLRYGATGGPAIESTASLP